MKILFFSLAVISMVFGIIGIVLPVWPTTPFLLLAAYLFGKSSPRFKVWLLRRSFLAPYVAPYIDKKGIPIKARNKAIILLWLTLLLSMCLIQKLWAYLLLTSIGAGVSFYLCSLPVQKKEND